MATAEYNKRYWLLNKERLQKTRIWFTKSCNFCSKEFETWKSYRKFCSRSCSSRSHPSGALGKKWGVQTKEQRDWQKNRWHHRKRAAEGDFTFKDWEELKRKHNYACLCCKKVEPSIKLTQDHIIPLSKSGTNYIGNIQPLCKSCNCKKLTKIITY